MRILGDAPKTVNVVNSEKKEGFAKAARTLYKRARCPLLFFFDSDGQCVASEFWKLAAEIEHCDCVLSVKKIHYDPLMRRMASRVFNSLARVYFNFDFKDINFGFRLVRRDAALRCLEDCRYMPTLLNSEMAILMHRYGYRLREVVVHHRPRLFGMSRGLEPGSLLKESWRAFTALSKIRKNAPHTAPKREAARSAGRG
jgi:Glycosyl transferase family 2